MKRVLVSLSMVAAVFSGLVHATDWTVVVKQVEPSILWANINLEGGCTAFIINQEKHYLLTAAHCFAGQQGTVYADSIPTRVVVLDQKKDLMVLEAKDIDPSRPALKLATKNPERGSEVMSVGYGFALERPFFRQAHVQDDKTMIPEDGIGGPFISTDSSFVGGQSGGPIVNGLGEVVAIVQRGDGGTTGLGVGAETIRERVGRFFGSKVK